MFDGLKVSDKVIVVRENRLIIDNRYYSLGCVKEITKAGNIKVEYNNGKAVCIFKPNGAEYGSSNRLCYNGSMSIIPYNEELWKRESKKNYARHIKTKLKDLDWYDIEDDLVLKVWEIVKINAKNN